MSSVAASSPPPAVQSIDVSLGPAKSDCVFCDISRSSLLAVGQKARASSDEKSKEENAATASTALLAASRAVPPAGTGTFPQASPPLSSREALYADEVCFVISDLYPAAELHLLVIPHEHVVSTDALTPSQLPLVQHMQSVAEKMIQQYGSSSKPSLLGFHIPPFYSIRHLHLHAFNGNFHSCCCCCSTRIKYTNSCCWFRNIEQITEKLGNINSNQKNEPPAQIMK